MKKLLALAVLLLCVAAVRAEEPAAANEGYLDLVERADIAIKASHWDRADSLLVAAMQLDPYNSGNVMLLSNLGMIRYYQGLDSAAIEALDQAHNIAPRSTAILTNRATVKTAMGRLDEAIADYDAALDLDSALVTPRFSRGMLRLKKGDIAGAATDMAMLDTIAPRSREAETGMAAILTATGQYADAAIRYTHVLDFDKQPEFYAARALCYLMTDRLAEASDDIASGLALDPTDGELYLYRAVLNKMRYRPDDARADAEKAVSLGVDRRRADTLLNSKLSESQPRK